MKFFDFFIPMRFKKNENDLGKIQESKCSYTHFL